MSKQVFKKIVFYLILVSFIAFVGLSIVVYYHPVMRFDIELSSELQAEGDTPLKRWLIFGLLSAVSFLGQTTVGFAIVICFAIFFWLYSYHWESLFCLIAATAPIINAGIKLLIQRPRPQEDLVFVLDHQLSPSYPSGHVVFFTVFFGYLIAAMVFAKNIHVATRAAIILISLFLICSVSFSRIYLGAHWITDVVAGYLLGIILLTLLLVFYLRKYVKI